MNETDTDTDTDTDKKTLRLHRWTMATYAMLLGGMLASVSNADMVVLSGGSVATLGVVFAYLFRRRARGSYLEQHYHFIIRTFWLCGLLFGAGMAISTGIMLSQMDLNTMAMAQTDPDSYAQIIKSLSENNRMALLLPQLPGGVWWCWRCARGMAALHYRRDLY